MDDGGIKMVEKFYELSTGNKIPSIGLGTWQSKPEDAYFAVKTALENGYRHIDTAAIYGNEKEVGQAIKDSGVPREEIFLTTKLWNDSHSYEGAKRAVAQSLENLGTDYFDLYLIHWPNPLAVRDHWEEANAETWRALEELYHDGTLKAIGVSNFLVHHLESLLKTAKVTPFVNQIRLAPGSTQPDVVAFCEAHDILLEAYSPFGTGKLFQNDQIKDIAKKYGKSVAQVALRWSLQHGFLPLPKSIHEDYIKANLEVFDFELTDEDVAVITNLTGVGEAPDPDNTNF